jgi:hypothetical protein
MPIPSLLPSVPSPGEQEPAALTRFNIVLANEDTAEAVVLDSALDAAQATIAFHQARQRLIHERVRGELVMVQHNRGARMLLRESLGTATSGCRSRPGGAARRGRLPRCLGGCGQAGQDRHGRGMTAARSSWHVLGAVWWRGAPWHHPFPARVATAATASPIAPKNHPGHGLPEHRSAKMQLSDPP